MNWNAIAARAQVLAAIGVALLRHGAL